MTDSARCGAPDDVLEVFPLAPAELGFVLGRLCIVFIILFLFLLCADPSRASFFVLPLSGRALLPRLTGSFFSSLVAFTSFSTSARKIYVVVCQGFLIGAPNEHHEFGLRIPIFGRGIDPRNPSAAALPPPPSPPLPVYRCPPTRMLSNLDSTPP
ncbi:hypothetical protein B0H13DRAFT_125983 [Mycena leptocephala]|nr:hypothetical protein B0H13DRAFT_125983 [Mycena leptocephala]